MRMKAGQSPKIVNLHGSLLVDRAVALKDELSEALEGSDNVLLGISEVEDIGLACLQVLYAAKKRASASGKELHFHGALPPRLSKRLAACGFLRSVSEAADGFESALVGF
jgi:anti-anti-sigma regulatory factor